MRTTRPRSIPVHGGAIRGRTRAQGGARFVVKLPRGHVPRIDAPGDAADNAAMEAIQ